MHKWERLSAENFIRTGEEHEMQKTNKEWECGAYIEGNRSKDDGSHWDWDYRSKTWMNHHQIPSTIYKHISICLCQRVNIHFVFTGWCNVINSFFFFLRLIKKHLWMWGNFVVILYLLEMDCSSWIVSNPPWAVVVCHCAHTKMELLPGFIESLFAWKYAIKY